MNFESTVPQKARTEIVKLRTEKESWAKVEAKECARGYCLQADSDPNTWIGSQQWKTEHFYDRKKTSDSKVWRTTWIVGSQEACFITQLKTWLLYLWSIRSVSLFDFTFTGESDILRGSLPACGFHSAAQLLWEKEVKWDEEECWLTQISRLSLSQRVGSESTVGAWGWLVSWLLS